MYAIRPGRSGLRKTRTPVTPRAGGRDDLNREITEEDREHLDTIERIRTARSVWEYRDLVARERYDGTDGQHYWTEDPLTGVAVPPDTAKPDWRVEWACPDLQSAIQQYAAINATSPVQYVGEPRTDSRRTREAASAAARVLGAMRLQTDIVEKRDEANVLAMVSGEVWGFGFWDYGRNCFGVDVAEAYEVFYRLGVKDPDQSHWLDRERWEPIETIRQRWPMPEKGEPDNADTRARRAAARLVREIEPTTTNIPAVVRERIALTGGFATSVTDDDIKGFVRYLEHFRQPDDDYPRGRWCVWVNDTLIWESDLPFIDYGVRIPAKRLAYFKVPGRARALGVMALGFSTQALVEDMVNAQVEHQRQMTWGKIIHDDRADLSEWNTEPGQTIAVPMAVGVDGVKVLRPDPADPSALRLPMYLGEKLNQQIGANDPNRGIVNKDVTLGEVEIAQAAGEVRMRSFYRDVDQWERGLMEIGLVLTQAMATDEQLTEMIGHDRVSELSAFREARFIDLEGQPRTVQVIAQSAPSLSSNDAVRERQVLMRLQAKIINEEQARDQLEMPTRPGTIATAWSESKRLLRDLVAKVRKGEPVIVHPLWEHAAMLQEAGQIATQRDYLDAPDHERAAIDTLFQEIERVYRDRAVGAAVMRGDRRATAGASAALLGGSSGTQGQSAPGVLTDPSANSSVGLDGPDDPGAAAADVAGDPGADAALLGY